jgi:hypothetical protein
MAVFIEADIEASVAITFSASMILRCSAKSTALSFNFGALGTWGTLGTLDRMVSQRNELLPILLRLLPYFHHHVTRIILASPLAS